MLQERRVLRGLQDVMVSKVPLVSQVLLDQLAHQVKMEIRVKLVSRVRRETEETRENRVHPDHQDLKGQSVSLVHLEPMESLDLGGNKVSLDRKVMKVPEDSLAHPVLSDCRVCLDLLVKREKREMLVRWVHLVHPALEVPTVLLEPTVPKVLLEELVILALLERRVTLERPENLVFLETLDHQVLKVKEEKKEKQVFKVLLVLLVQKVLLVMMVQRVALVLVDFREILVLLVNLDPLVKMGLLVIREMMVNLVKLDHPVLLESLVHPVHQGRGVLLVQPVLKADKEKKVVKVNQAWRVLPERQVLLVLKVLLENLDLKV